MHPRNPKNERIIKRYREFLQHADGKSEATIRQVEKAIRRYEDFDKRADFANFNQAKAIAFKRHLQDCELSLATMLPTLTALKRFFAWLGLQPGYKSKIHASDVEFLNLPDKDIRAAKAPSTRGYPTIEQIEHVIANMPADSDIEHRNRALIAFIAITGIRDGAVISLRMKHVDIGRALVVQTPREVRTKFGKHINTFFFPISPVCEQIVEDWIHHAREKLLFGPDDPVFPKTRVGHDADDCFAADGLSRQFWSTASAVRTIFKDAFIAAGLPPQTPHSLRHMLAHLAYAWCRTPERFKAWSQNLGHDSPLTTFTSYGNVATVRQGELVRMAKPAGNQEEVLAKVREMLS